MKKIIILILVTFTFFGCGEDIEFNTPSFQGEKDGNLWEAVSYKANIGTTGVLTIVASDNFETITLATSSATVAQYNVVGTTSFGSLLDINDVFYTTNNTPDPSVQLFPASGVIDLREVNFEEGYVSGEFYFNAFNSSGLTSINVNKGFFYKVPLTVAEVSTGVVSISCATATSTVAATSISFSAVAPGDPNYATLCNAYKTALTTQISSCGDAGGALQTIIDGLTCM